jgi:hypothetical protein
VKAVEAGPDCDVVVSRRSRIAALPRELREELNRRLTAGEFQGYLGLAQWLRRKGYGISGKEIRDYGGKLEQRLEAVRIATEQARAVVAASPDDDNRMGEALLRLVQHHLFTVLVELNPQDPKQADLRNLARTVAELGRAAIMQKKFAEELRERVAQRVATAQAKVMSTVREAAEGRPRQGLTPQAEQEIRDALMEISH